MKDTSPERKIQMLKYIHFILNVGVFAVFWWLHKWYVDVRVSPRYDYFVYGLYALMSYFLGKTYNCYLIGFASAGDLIFSNCVSSFIGNFCVIASTTIVWHCFYNPLFLILTFVVQCVLSIIWAKFSDAAFYRICPPKTALIIYRHEDDLARVRELDAYRHLFRVSGKLQASGDDLGEIKDSLSGYETLIVTGVPATLRNGIAKYCVENNIPGYFMPHIGDIIMSGSAHIQSFSIPVQTVSRAYPDPAYALVKRLCDIIVSFTGLLLTGPVMLITAFLIWAEDRGPVFYRQVRLTKDGKHFQIVKFRSMKVDAEKDGIARLASEKDSRITKVGAFIRRCRIDELPQLWNILKGDMSLVGPRPERPEIALDYAKDMPAFDLRLQVKAGLTGYAQVYGKYNTTPYDKLQFDLMYINKMNIVTDLQLVFATIKILFLKKSTEGIAEGKTDAR